MKKIILPFIAFTIVTFTSCSVLSDLNIKPSNLETVMALKNILDSSTFKALKAFNGVNDDGIASVLPDEINTVLKTLKTFGYGKEVDQVTLSISNASKVMLKESEGIIGDAISELKFTDAVAVVLGGEDAATNVLKRAMYDTVKKRYSARIEQELGKTEALTYWPIAASGYNVFAKKKVNSSLPDFLAERSVDAVFLAMGKQEASIRTDYKSLGNSVVTKVFDYYSKNKK
jgi:hypothetical protein